MHMLTMKLNYLFHLFPWRQIGVIEALLENGEYFVNWWDFVPHQICFGVGARIEHNVVLDGIRQWQCRQFIYISQYLWQLDIIIFPIFVRLLYHEKGRVVRGWACAVD